MAKSTLLVRDSEQSLYRLDAFRGEPFLPDETYVSVAVRAISLKRGLFGTAKYGPYIYGILGQTNFNAQTKLAGIFAPATENRVFNQPMSRSAVPMGGASTATTRTQLDEANFPRGYFQGGTFAENSYLTTNIGLGVERFLEDRWSIFAQPTYQHGFLFMNEGLGPFQDQLRTMSFFTGIRVRLVK